MNNMYRIQDNLFDYLFYQTVLTCIALLSLYWALGNFEEAFFCEKVIGEVVSAQKKEREVEVVAEYEWLGNKLEAQKSVNSDAKSDFRVGTSLLIVIDPTTGKIYNITSNDKDDTFSWFCITGAVALFFTVGSLAFPFYYSTFRKHKVEEKMQ